MGCNTSDTDSTKSSAKEPTGPGLEIGFGEWIHSPSLEAQCAVKSGHSIFDINNVTLDFYYGHAKYNQHSEGPSYGEFPRVGLYFWNKQSPPLLIMHQDYCNIDKGYFAKEIALREWTSDKYAYTVIEASPSLPVALDPSIRIQLNHYDPLTIPAEVFVEESGTLVFCVVYIDQEGGGYNISGSGNIFIDYEYINEQTVRLSRSSS